MVTVYLSSNLTTLIISVMPFIKGLNKVLSHCGPSDAIWRHIQGSILFRVTACCLSAQNHHRSHSAKTNLTRSVHELNPYHVFGIKIFKMITTSPIASELKWTSLIKGTNRNISQRTLWHQKHCKFSLCTVSIHPNELGPRPPSTQAQSRIIIWCDSVY